MATISLSQMRDIVRFRGSYENSQKFTDARINVEINAAWAELYEIQADANEGYWDTSGSVSTVAAQEHVNLPADFWRLRGVDILIGGKYRALRQVGIEERNDFQSSSGEPVGYRVASGGTRGRLILYPTPSAIYSIRVVYTPSVTALAADGDTIEAWNDWSEYVITGALLRMDQREERPLAERQQELERLRQRIVKATAQRRAAEPEYLTPKNDLFGDFDLYWLS